MYVNVKIKEKFLYLQQCIVQKANDIIYKVLYINILHFILILPLLKFMKKFAMRGNVIDMAVGVIIGGAFGKIVSSVVADIIMPPLGLLIGGVNFTDLKWVMKGPEVVDGVEQAAVTLNYGNFLQATFDFLIIAFSIFLFIRLLTKLTEKKKEEQTAPAPAPAPSEEVKLLSEIRDLLKKNEE